MDGSVFYIGFSGHQHLGDELTQAFVYQQLRDLLSRYLQEHKSVVGYSAVALGADRLFMKTAFDLNMPVEAVIPCTQYEEIFTADASREEYHCLLEQCQQVHRMSFDNCSEDAYLFAGQWIVDHCDVLVLAWNGYPPGGKGGTADVASYARQIGRPFIHINTLLYIVKEYNMNGSKTVHTTAKRKFTVSKETRYQGSVLTVNRYHLHMPNGDDIERDIVERPESVLVLPVTQQQHVLLIEEYDLGAETWQLSLPGGKVTDTTLEGIQKQAETELREETGYRPGRLEKLLDFYSHPGYIAHKVHVYIAHDLEWDPLDMEEQEEIKLHIFTLEDALAATKEDYRFDPEAALSLWLYAAYVLQGVGGTVRNG